MKRCSVCEFIYEDDQRFCDMDGTELPKDAGLFQLSQGVPAPTAASRSRRFLQSPFSLAAVSLLGVILSAIAIGYYDFVSQADSNAANRASVGNLVPSAHAETTDNSGSQEATTASEVSTTDALHSDDVGTRDDSATANSETSSQRSTPAARTSRAAYQKRDSKVTKMFKKTGRFITKPFKRL